MPRLRARRERLPMERIVLLLWRFLFRNEYDEETGMRTVMRYKLALLRQMAGISVQQDIKFCKTKQLEE